MIKYESIGDANRYFYLVKSGTVFKDDILYQIECAPHFHKNIEFLFILDGEQTIKIDGKNYTLSKGQFSFVDSYQPHSYESGSATGVILVLGAAFFDKFQYFYQQNTFQTVFADTSKNKKIIEFVSFWEESFRGQRDKLDMFDVFSNATHLFYLIKNAYGTIEKKQNNQSALVISALKYIDENYDKNISLQTCSNAIGYSKEYISKQFNTIVGESFKQYVNQIRMEKYKKLINESNISNKELAKRCGFNSTSTFYRALKK